MKNKILILLVSLFANQVFAESKTMPKVSDSQSLYQALNTPSTLSYGGTNRNLKFYTKNIGGLECYRVVEANEESYYCKITGNLNNKALFDALDVSAPEFNEGNIRILFKAVAGLKCHKTMDMVGKTIELKCEYLID